MAKAAKPHAKGKVKPGDVTKRVGVEQIRARGVNVEELLEKLIDAAGAEFTTYYYYTVLRMYLAGNEDYKEICEDARLEDRAHFELITPRIYELGGELPTISAPSPIGLVVQEDAGVGFVLLCSAYPRPHLRVRTHQKKVMRRHRYRHGLPAPGRLTQPTPASCTQAGAVCRSESRRGSVQH